MRIFKGYLVGNTAINTNGNGEIETTEATAFSGQIDIHGLGVSDLTGLEAFVNLNMLTAYNNPYTTINLTNNTKLTYMFVAQTGLTTLDVTHLPQLRSLLFGQTSISAIDLSNNPQLSFFNAPETQMTSIDLSDKTQLNYFNVNQFSQFNLGKYQEWKQRKLNARFSLSILPCLPVLR